jgi:hypothetical protein
VVGNHDGKATSGNAVKAKGSPTPKDLGKPAHQTQPVPMILLTKPVTKEGAKEVRRKLTKALSMPVVEWDSVNKLFNAYVYCITKYIDAEVLASCHIFYRTEYKPVMLSGDVHATFIKGQQVFAFTQSEVNSKLAHWLYVDSRHEIWTASPISNWFSSMHAFVMKWWLDNHVSLTTQHVAHINAHPPKG